MAKYTLPAGVTGWAHVKCLPKSILMYTTRNTEKTITLYTNAASRKRMGSTPASTNIFPVFVIAFLWSIALHLRKILKILRLSGACKVENQFLDARYVPAHAIIAKICHTERDVWGGGEGVGV
jgi:hypothetical protein